MQRLLAFLVLLASSAVYGQSVSIDFDNTVDFSTVKTYAWQEGTPALNRLSHQRVVNAVNYELSMKGLELVESNPDTYLTYHASTEEEIRVRDFGYAGPRWTRHERIDVRNVLVGMLVVDMLNTDRELIWRGIASGSVSSQPEKNEKKINKAAKKMFKKFPPRKK